MPFYYLHSKVCIWHGMCQFISRIKIIINLITPIEIADEEKERERGVGWFTLINIPQRKQKRCWPWAASGVTSCLLYDQVYLSTVMPVIVLSHEQLINISVVWWRRSPLNDNNITQWKEEDAFGHDLCNVTTKFDLQVTDWWAMRRRLI